MREETLHEGVGFLGEPFLRNIFALFHKSTGCLLFTFNYVGPIIRCSTTRDTLYFLFDSHCRNSHGITDSPFGFLVLLELLTYSSSKGILKKPIILLIFLIHHKIRFISVNVND